MGNWLVVLLVGFLSVSAGAAEDRDARSIADLESSWVSQSGKTLKLSDLRGRPRMITMFYTNCPYQCPLTIATIQKLIKELPAALQKRLAIDLFSFESKDDTPAQLKAFVEKKNLDPEKWTLYRSDAEGVRELATLLGISYKKTDKIDYSHTTMITVVDEKGVIRFQQEGTALPPKDAAGRITSALGRR